MEEVSNNRESEKLYGDFCKNCHPTGTVKLVSMVFAAILLVFGGAVGFYLLDQKYELEEDISAIVFGDRVVEQSKLNRKEKNENDAMMEGSTTLVEDEDRSRVVLLFNEVQFIYPQGWHVLVESKDIFTTEVSMKQNPIMRVEGGSYDPVTLTVTSAPTEIYQAEKVEDYVTQAGNSFEQYRSETSPESAWFDDRTIYVTTLGEGQEGYVLSVEVLNQHEDIDSLNLDNLLDSFVLVGPAI